MASTTGRTVRGRLLAVLLVAGLVASACTSKVSHTTPSSGPVGSAPAPFDQADVDAFVHDLAAAGIGTYQLGSAKPMVPMTAATAVRFTDEQAANAALGAHAHSGLTGADIDSIVVPDPLADGAQPLPASLLIAAWAQTKDSPGAKLAKRLLGSQDWSKYQAAVFPTAVLSLFTADLISTAPTATPPGTPTSASSLAGQLARDAAPLAGPVAGARAAASASICEQFLNFVTETTNTVFDAIGHLPTWDASQGAWWEQALKWAGNLLPTAINYAIDTVKFVVVNGEKVLLGPIVSAVASVASVIAVVAAVLLAVQPWVGEIKPDPVVAHRGAAANPGTFDLVVTAVGSTPDEWPAQIAGCAKAAGVTLPALKPHDAEVKWTIDYESPEPMIRRTSDTGPLDKDGKATLRYETVTETPEVAAGDEQVDGSVKVSTGVHRKDLDEVRDRLLNSLWNNIPLPKIVLDTLGPTLRAIIDPKIKAALEPLTKIQDVDSFTVLSTTYHKAKEPTPKPGSSAPGTTLALPKNACTLVSQAEAARAAGMDVLGGEAQYDIEILGQLAHSCVWKDPGYPARAFIRIDIFDFGPNAANTFANKAQFGTTIVPDVGDEASCFCLPQGANLFVRKANLIMHIAIITPGGATSSVQVAKIILRRL